MGNEPREHDESDPDELRRMMEKTGYGPSAEDLEQRFRDYLRRFGDQLIADWGKRR